MNQELRWQYQWPQVLIFALQLGKWPFEGAISREEAFAEVVRFASILRVEVKPDDLEFLPTVAGEIAKLLSQSPEQPTPRIPPGLAKLAKDYKKYLAQEREKRKKLSSSQRIIQNQIKNQLVAQFEPLKQNRELAEEVSFNLSNQVVANLPPVAIKVAFKKEDYQTTLKDIEPEFAQRLKQAGASPKTEKIKTIRQNLVETTFEQAQGLAATPREKILEEGPPKISPEEGKVFKAEEELERKIGAGFLQFGISPYAPEELQLLNRTAKEIITSHLLGLPKEEITQERYEELLRKIWPRIREKLEKRGFSFSQTQVENFIKELIKKTQPEATILTTTARRPFSREIAARLEAEEEGIAFWPVYPLSQPKLIWAYLKRAIFSPPKKALEIAASEISPEGQEIWSQMIEKGLFAEDLEASISTLKGLGLPESHPTIQKLLAKKEKILAFQKRAGEDKPAVRILKSYYELSKLTGRQQIYEPETKMFLPQLSPASIKTRFQQFLNRIGLATRLYQKIILAPGKTVIHPLFSEKLMRFLTHHRFSSFSLGQIIKTLAKTGLGQTLKAGVKRGAVWLATKLGVKTVAAAIGVAGGPPGGVISTILLVAEKIIKFVWNKILKPIVSKIIQIIKEPEKALGTIAAGILTIIILPMPIALIGVIPITLGGIGLIGVGVSSAGTTASGLAAKITAFFAILTTAPFAVPIAGLVVAIIGTLAALTFLIVITTAGAFILPTVPTPSRYLEPIPPTAIEPKCVNLINIISDTANTHCVPPSILMAISRMEASGVWGWTCEEADFFSTPGWWEKASQAVKDRGYCYDTCARTGLCRDTTVMGPMQFEENAWKGVMPGYDLMDRCRLDLSLEAAAKKIKSNSGTKPDNCGPWDEKTVRHIGYRYCGSCGTYGCQLNPDPNDTCSPACGYDYCGNVWYLYQQYESR